MEILGTLEVTITRFSIDNTPTAFIHVGKKLLGTILQLPNSKWYGKGKQFQKIHQAVNYVLLREGYL